MLQIWKIRRPGTHADCPRTLTVPGRPGLSQDTPVLGHMPTVPGHLLSQDARVSQDTPVLGRYPFCPGTASVLGHFKCPGTGGVQIPGVACQVGVWLQRLCLSILSMMHELTLILIDQEL